MSAQHRFFINSRAILERTDPILLGYEALGAQGLAQSGVVAGDFMKLRTLSASYTLPESIAELAWASRVAVTASIDNLWTIWQKSKESFGHPIMDIERARQRSRSVRAQRLRARGLAAAHQVRVHRSVHILDHKERRDASEKQAEGFGPVHGFLRRVLGGVAWTRS